LLSKAKGKEKGMLPGGSGFLKVESTPTEIASGASNLFKFQ
jgi:hypothetical protein